jgi:two-component system response regulator HydG
MMSPTDIRLVFGRSSVMRALYQQCELIAPTSYPVLLIGETGTGKTWLARAIHELSRVKHGPRVECAIPHLGSLALDQLVGHCKGAFTGASERYRGRIEQATGGSLFLDEVGLASPRVQAILLTLVEAQTVTPLGSEREIPVRVRVIAATNEPLAKRVRQGRFREDLYYRLGVLPLILPPLRKRRADIPLLASHFLATEAASEQLPVPVLSPEAIRRLQGARWPGNLRELRTVMIRALLRARGCGVIQVGDLQFDPDPEVPKAKGRKFPPEIVRTALKRAGNNKSRAAAELGCSRKTIQRNTLLAVE